jgi:hypothetical protein
MQGGTKNNCFICIKVLIQIAPSQEFLQFSLEQENTAETGK